MNRPPLRNLLLSTVALTLFSLASCRDRTPEPSLPLETPDIHVEALAKTPEALIPWAPHPRSKNTLRVEASWPTSPQLHGIRAPEGEAFLWVLPLPSANETTSFLAATIPTHALKSSLYSSFTVSQPPTWSLLLYPGHDALAAGGDSDIQRVDELSNIQLPQRRDGSEVPDSTLFYAELAQDRLVKVCVPSVSSEQHAGATQTLASSCEYYLWDATRGLQSLPHSLRGEPSFAPRHPSPYETSMEEFFLSEDGVLYSKLRVPLPPRGAPPTPLELAIAWETSPLQTQPWFQSKLSKELRAWHGLSLAQCDEAQLFYAAGRLLALRHLASDVIETKKDYLAFEADILLQMAAIAERHWGRWEAWEWLAQFNELLDQHADQALPRPHASLMLVPEKEEKPSLNWRGDGQLLDRAVPATWLTSETGALLRMPRGAGIRYCDAEHCLRALPDLNTPTDTSDTADSEPPEATGATESERGGAVQAGAAPEDSEQAQTAAETVQARARAKAQADAARQEAANIPSLIHPEGQLQFVDCWSEEHGAWSLFFTTTHRQQRCEPNALCGATCDAVSYESLPRLSKYQGPCYARVPLPATNGPKQTRAVKPLPQLSPEDHPRGSSCQQSSRTIEKPQPLFWLNDDTLLFSDAEGFYQASVSQRTWESFDERGLSGPQKSVAGIDSEGNRYILRHVANELSVWKQTGDTLELLALPNLLHPSTPLSDHGWAVPNPDGSELAVIFGGQLLGVWDLSPAPAKADEDADDDVRATP